MRKPTLLLLLLSVFTGFSQVKSTDFESFKLGGKRTVQLYVPEDYSEEKMYPLLVVFEAEILFDITVANTKFYSSHGDMPQAIIAGINQGSSVDEDCAYGESSLPEDKSTAFFEFVAMELVPSLAKQYKLTNFKAAIGQGASANFINYFLLKEKPLFNAYLSFSPELAPKMPTFVADRLNTLQTMNFYYLANAENAPKDTKETVKSLNASIKGLTNEKLHYNFDEFAGAGSYSVSAYALPKALDQIFNVYKPISKEEYKSKVLTFEKPVIEYLTEKYTTIEQLFGFKKQVSLNDIMAIYAATKKKEDLPSLLALSEVAKKEYPETMLGFFLEAEYYEQLGEAKKAMRTYEKAFGMSEIDFITKDLALQRIDKIKQDFGW